MVAAAESGGPVMWGPGHFSSVSVAESVRSVSPLVVGRSDGGLVRDLFSPLVAIRPPGMGRGQFPGLP